jgi:hypothetical protein
MLRNAVRLLRPGLLLGSATVGGGAYVASPAVRNAWHHDGPSPLPALTPSMLDPAEEAEDELPRVLPEPRVLRHRWNRAVDDACGRLAAFCANRGL